MLASVYPQKILQGDVHAFEHMAWILWLVIAGTFATAISSTLASFLGAPRILSAMGKDGLMPMIDFFAEKSNSNSSPLRGTCTKSII